MIGEHEVGRHGGKLMKGRVLKMMLFLGGSGFFTRDNF